MKYLPMLFWRPTAIFNSNLKLLITGNVKQLQVNNNCRKQSLKHLQSYIIPHKFQEFTKCGSLCTKHLIFQCQPIHANLCYRQFHTTRRCDAIPPVIWVVISFLSKVTAAFTGRRWRNWLKTQPPEVRQKYFRRMMIRLLAIAGFGTALGVAYYMAHLQEAPITERKRFISLTKEQYMKAANFETESLISATQDKQLPKSHPFYDEVLLIASQIVKCNQDFPGIMDHQWTIHIIDTEEKNAMVFPNGNIFVYTGLLKFVENRDQLAIILGHEMAHALLLHGAEQLSYSQFLDYFVIGVMAAIWILMPTDGIAIVTHWFYNKVMDLSVHKPYNRMLEKEADKVGLYLTAKACYDVREGSVLWNYMAVSDDLQAEVKIPEFLSTHPTHYNRVKYFEHLMPKALAIRENKKCPCLPQVDPRVRAVQIRKEVDNVLIARATKANVERLRAQPILSPVIPALRGPSVFSTVIKSK